MILTNVFLVMAQEWLMMVFGILTPVPPAEEVAERHFKTIKLYNLEIQRAAFAARYFLKQIGHITKENP